MSNDITGGLRNLKGGSIDALRGPYPTVAAANLAIPDTIVDDLNFREGKFVDIGIKPNLVTHWWKGGYKNENLVEYIEVTQAKFNTVAPIAGMLILSENLLNNNELVFGGWSKTGGKRISSTELRTPLIQIDPSKVNITFSGGFNIGTNMARFVFFDKNEVFISYSDDLTTAIPSNARFVGVSVANSAIMGNDPTQTQFTITAMLNYGTVAKPWQGFNASIDNTRIKNLDLKTLVRFYNLYNSSGKNKFDLTASINGKVIRAATGLIEDRADSALSNLIPVKPGTTYSLSGLTNTTKVIRFVDAAGTPLKPKKTDGTDYGSYSYTSGAFIAPPGSVYFQLLWKYNNIGVSDQVQFEKGSVSTQYESFVSKIGSDQIEGDVNIDLTGYTKTGGSSKTTMELDTAVQQASSGINSAISVSNTAILKADEAKIIADSNSNQIQNKQFDSNQIRDAAINLAKLNQSVLDFINASGGGVINNFPDEKFLTKNPGANGTLTFKDGADGYARISAMSTVSAQITELKTKSENYKSIIIQESFDLASSTGARSTLLLPDNTTIKFVGNGMLRNTYLYGKNLIIQADRVRIFDNVQFFVYGAGGVQVPSTSNNILTVNIPATSTVDFFNKKTRTVYLASSGATVNPFDTKPMHAKMPNLSALTNVSGVWRLRIGQAADFPLTSSGSNVVIPISNKYIFFDKDTDAVLASGLTYDPLKIKGTYLVNYNRTLRSSIYGDVFPEWFGAKADGITDSTDAINISSRIINAAGGGCLNFENSGLQYMSRGGIVLLSNVQYKLNYTKLKLMNNASEHLIIHDDIETISRCNITPGYLDGNKSNQTLSLDIIHIGWPYGQPFYSQDASYCFSESDFSGVYAEFAKGHGFYVAVPGDIVLASCRSRYNELDGFYWEKEHFKFMECMAWYNGRDGIHTDGGNHFSIIGGKNAHNGRNNINLENAFEFQLSALATIDAVNGANLNIANCYGFMINNLRCVGPSVVGIRIDIGSRNGKILGVIDKGNTTSIINASSTVEVRDVVSY